MTPELQDLVLKHYQTGEIYHIYDLGGTYNLNLRLESASGPFVLRVYRPWVHPERLQQIQAQKRTLFQAGFPVCLPMTTRDGSTFFRFRDRLAECEPFITHDPPVHDQFHYMRAFTFLGRLHSQLARQTVADFVQPLVSNYILPEEQKSWLAHVQQKIQQTTSSHSLDQQIASDICRVTVQLTETLQHWWKEEGNRLPQQLIHGDYRLGNILFHKQQEAPVALLDLEFIAVRERLYDIAYALYWMLWQQNAIHNPTQEAWKQILILLSHYNAATHTPLTQQELMALPVEIARIPLYWIAEARFVAQPVPAIVRLATSISFAEWALQSQAELITILLT